jgi:hypothetical protein
MPGTLIRSLVCAVTLLALSTAPAVAQTFDKRIDITFNAPVTVPGATLPPGTYQFRLANPTTGRNVVHVFDKDGTLHASFLTRPINLGRSSENAEVRLYERRGPAPFVIRAWWHPSDPTGFEAVYPRGQAEHLAMSVNEPVLTSRATATALVEANDLARISAKGEEAAVH